MKMEAACAENHKRGFARARSLTKWSIFFAPASVMWTFLSEIGHRHEKLATSALAQGYLDGRRACPSAECP